MGDGDTSSGPDPQSRLAHLLAALARGADGRHGARLWEGLRDLLSPPPGTGPGGHDELAALQRAPDDAAAAATLAGIMHDRAAADEDFGQAMGAWRGQHQIRAIEGAAPSAAPPGPRTTAGTPAAPADAGLAQTRATPAESRAAGPPAGPPPGSTPAARPGPDDRAAGAIRRGRRILANPYSVTILGGVVVAVVTVWLTAHASSPGTGQAAAGPPASQPTSPSPGPARSGSQPVTGLQSSGASCQGMPQAGPEHVSAHPPLAVLSADPMGVLGTSYALPGQHVLSPAALSRLNKSQASGGPGSGAYLVSIGGYAVGTNGTQVVVRNTSRHKISILGIRAVRESCQAPLTGTIFANSSSGADLSVNLGFELDSPDSEARAATGDAVTATSPDYFDKYTVSIRPGRQQVFNLIAVTARHAWSVRYLVTMLVGGTKSYQLLADGTQPFRVTAGLPSGRFYSVAYAGGVASPDQSGDFERINPRYLNQR